MEMVCWTDVGAACLSLLSIFHFASLGKIQAAGFCRAQLRQVTRGTAGQIAISKGMCIYCRLRALCSTTLES